MKARTDEETICSWMEPKPGPHDSPDGVMWWGCMVRHVCEWFPRELDLDALHLVEERLSARQCASYLALLAQEGGSTIKEPGWRWWRLAHASAALAKALRSEVKNAE